MSENEWPDELVERAKYDPILHAMLSNLSINKPEKSHAIIGDALLAYSKQNARLSTILSAYIKHYGAQLQQIIDE